MNRQAEMTEELSRKPLGYSVRGASVASEQLAKIYASIEAQIYYYLPKDAAKETHTAENSPRRFFYIPSMEGKPVIGQVCYRATDTAGRPGAYFAHVLVGETDSPWKSVDVLRLWNAPFWVKEDEPGLQSELKSYEQVSQIENAMEGMSDERFAAWINRAEKWYAQSGSEKVEITPAMFEKFMAGVLSVWKDASKKIILVADSATAALFFYGLFRLVPSGWGAHAAFSTYEHSPMDFCGRICATTFDNPQESDLPAELYSHQFVFNVFTGKQTPILALTNPPLAFVKGDSKRYPITGQGEYSYGKTIVRRLQTDGWTGVAELRQLASALNLKPGSNLDYVVATEHALFRNLGLTLRIIAKGLNDDMLPLSAAFPPHVVPIWRLSSAAAAYMQTQLSQTIRLIDINETNVAAKLQPIIGTGAHLMILELLGTQSSDEKSNLIVLYLLKTLPANLVAPWLTLENTSESAKLTMLLRHINVEGVLPPGTEKIIFEGEQTALLAKLLVKLDLERQKMLWIRYSDNYAQPLIAALAQGVAYHGGDVVLLDRRIEKMTDEDILKLYRFGSERFFAEYPIYSSAMGEKLTQLVSRFESHAEDFDVYLNTISAGSHLLSQNMAERVNHWTKFKAAAKSIITEPDAPLDVLDARMGELVKEFSAAAPENECDQRAPTLRRRFIQQIIGVLFPVQKGFDSFLPPTSKRNEQLWEKVESYFEDGQWKPTRSSLGAITGMMGIIKPITQKEEQKPAAPPKQSEAKKKFKLTKVQSAYLLIASGAALLITLLVLVNLEMFTGTEEQDSHLFNKNTNAAQDDTAQNAPGDSSENKPVKSPEVKPVQAENVHSDSAEENTEESAPLDSVTPIAPFDWSDAPEYGDTFESAKPKDELSAIVENLNAERKKNPAVMFYLSKLAAKTELEISQIKESLNEPQRICRGAIFQLPSASVSEALNQNGELDLVSSGLIDAVNMKDLKLGPGFFVFQDKVIRWGAGDVFDPQKPVTQYRLTDLESALNLSECTISLVFEPTTVKMVLSAQAKALQFDKNDKKQHAASLEQREMEYKALSAQLREYKREGVPENARNKIVQTMGIMVSVPIAAVPAKPQKAAFGKDDQAYRTAGEDYRVASDAYSRQRDAVVKKAQEVEQLLSKEIDRLKNVQTIEQDKANALAEKSLAELIGYLKQSVFVLYRPNGFSGKMSLGNDNPFPQNNSGDKGGAPVSPSAPIPPVNSAAAADAAKSPAAGIPDPFAVQEQLGDGEANPPRAADANSQPNPSAENKTTPAPVLPVYSDKEKENVLSNSWSKPTQKKTSVKRKPGNIGIIIVKLRNGGKLQKMYSIESQLVQNNAQGDNTPSKFVPGSSNQSEIIVGTVECAVRFRFTNKEDPTKYFDTPWGYVSSIKEKNQYEIIYEISPGDLELLTNQ